MKSNLLKEHIYKLEKKLLQPETRHSAKEISELLSNNYIEFCSSGKIYKYKRGDKIDTKENSDKFVWEIKDFDIDILTDNLILAKYKVIKSYELEDKKICSLRSSIWKLVDGKWVIVFHQGTITENI